MKNQLMLVVLALAAAGVCLAGSDSGLGSWKLDESKSKIAPGAGKNATVVYEKVGDQMKVTTDGVDGSGKPMHTEWTGKYDGKDYPVHGAPAGTTRSVRQPDAHSLEGVNKVNGKETVKIHVKYAADGKSRTLTTVGKGEDGKERKSVYYYTKE